MNDSFCSELHREMESALEEEEEINTNTILNLQYEIVEGLRTGSLLLWATHEQQLYYRNSFSTKTQQTAYTCRFPNCRARVFVRNDGTAFRDIL